MPPSEQPYPSEIPFVPITGWLLAAVIAVAIITALAAAALVITRGIAQHRARRAHTTSEGAVPHTTDSPSRSDRTPH